jgi:mannosyltransferase
MQETVSIEVFNRTMKVRVVLILTVLILVAAMFRFYRLTEPSLWLDELFSMNGADPATTLHDVYEYSKGDQPPFFFYLLHGWLKVFGYTDFAGRSLTVLLGITGIPAIYFLGKEFKGTSVGLVAAFITAINWFHADISREIRFYPLVFLLSTLSYLFFLRSIRRSKITDFFFYALFTGLLLNTHYYALVVFVSQLILFLVVVIFYQRNNRLIIGGLAAGVVAGLSILHWMPIILKDLQTDQFHVVAVSFDFPIKFGWMYFKDPVAVIVYAFCIFLMIKYLIEKFSGRRLPVEDLVLLGWIFIGFMVPLLYSWIKIPLLTPKYSTITLPGIFLFIACGFTLIARSKWKVYAVGGLFVGAFIASFISRPLNRPRVAEDWRDVAHYFADHSDRPQTIFAQLAYFHLFYFNHFGYDQELPIDQRWADFKQIADSSTRIWLLRHPRYPDEGFKPEQQRLIDSLFHLKDEVQFRETKAFLYERKK